MEQTTEFLILNPENQAKPYTCPIPFEPTGNLKGQERHETANILRDKLLHGDHLYFSMTNKIGDMVVASALIEGLTTLRRQAGNNKPVTIYAPYGLYNLFKPFAEKRGIQLVAGTSDNGHNGLHRAKKTIESSQETNCLVVDLGIFNGRNEVEHDEKSGSIFLRDFVGFVLHGQYDNHLFGNRRYARAIEDMFGFQPNSLFTNESLPLPTLNLPEDAQQRYEFLCYKYNIDPDKPQVSISLEASNPGRIYSLDKWEEVIKQLREDYSNLQINLVWNPNKHPEDRARIDPEKILALANKYGCKSINESLMDIMVLFSQQRLVLACDSGPAHLAECVERGPKVLALFIPPDVNPNLWVINPGRMFPLTAPYKNRYPDGGDYCTEDNRKWVNLIKPHTIVSAARELLIENLSGFPDYTKPIQDSSLREIQDLYFLILQRAPDGGGLTSKYRDIEAGKSIQSILFEMLESDELQDKLEAWKTEGRKMVISALYRIILKRDYDDAGFQEKCNSNRSLKTIAQEMYESEEHRKRFL